MSSMCCAEKHHSHVYTSGNGKKSLREIEIPPRKLFSRRTKLSDQNPNHLFADVVSDKIIAEDALLHKFLPCNSGDNDDDDGSDDPYSSDDFRMYEFKVRRCMRSRSHDWTDCPFAHPGEKARRRDPRRYHYSGNVCTDFRRGGCRRGDACEFAHGVFECWLHPARYRTQACKDGKNCKRKVCFFAHTPRQLRVLPLHTSSSSPTPVSAGTSPVTMNQKYPNPSNHCCVFCHSSIASSPTSTLMGLSHLSPPMSPPLSPPLSPGDGSMGATFSPLSRFNNEYDSITLNQLFPMVLGHKNALAELVSSLEAMDLGNGGGGGGGAAVSPSSCEDQQEFILSPSAPPQLRISNSLMDEGIINNNNNEWCCPDLEWVNELVM
ncbi:zinc finger CCCH domain-containing protein 2-like [Telopea speciosissima]|uniref:zinc finger CCCH domain-containing protein 2-like n=1 Tax=Telopea speciosissima TaxID=54955 RepID=UPI001CC34ABA|nr:zinc finger CCCH domain-containing protein 2-like [Telopea speciosissima]